MKRGFTLIELLAVIVILAIIATIAVPTVLNIINDSKESSLLRSAEFYLDAVEYTIADAFLYHGGLSDGEYPITPSGNICKKALPCDDTNTLKVEVNGGKPTGGSITIANGNIEDVEIVLSEKTIVKNSDGELVYQSVPEPKSFAEDSWEVIAANVKAGNLSKYKVGDTKEIELTGFGTKTVRIANTSTPEECNSPGFSQTTCGFVVEFVEIITTHTMNDSNTISGGWEASGMRSYLNNNILNAFPTELKNIIIDTYVVSGQEAGVSNNYVTTDKVYLLSTNEVWGKKGTSSSIGGDLAETKTRQLDYYEINGVTTDNRNGSIKSNSDWWLRAVYASLPGYIYYVSSDGWFNGYYANNAKGVSPAFRL